MTNTAVTHPPDLDGRTLVRELTHRINNQLSSAIDVVTVAAVRADNPEVKVALGKVVELPQEQANVQRVLTVPEGDALVDVAQYLRKLCLATTRSRLEPIGVHLSFHADTLLLEPERCWRLGMALHELMTNSAQHACFETVMAAGDMATGDVMASMATAAIPTPKATAATTSPSTGAMFTGAFWFVPPTSRDKQSRTPRCRVHRGCFPERSSASSSRVFDHDHASYIAHVLSSPPVLRFRHDRNLLGVKAAAAAKLSGAAFSPREAESPGSFGQPRLPKTLNQQLRV